MSRINATTITGLGGAAPTFTNGVVVTGVITATTFSGALNGNATTASSTPYWFNAGAGTNEIKTGTGDGASYTTYNVAFRSWWGIGFRDYTDSATVNAYLDCRTGNFGTKGKLLAGNVSDTGTASQNFQVSGGAYVSGNLGIGTTNPLSRLQVSGGESRFGGVIETVSTATTYSSATGALVLELDVRQATTYTYTIPTGANIGIVSFKNMPAPTGNSSGTTITCILTQNAAGTGNTTATTGIGTNCTVVGYENSAAVAGISTRALVGSGTSLTLSTTASDRDFVSFFVHYTGASNTTASSYQVYVTKNGGFR